jgi:outer membrane protein, adhesin transport system
MTSKIATKPRSGRGPLGLAVALVCAVSLAPAAYADGLTDSVAEALATNPEIGAIRFNRRAIDQELQAARGLQLPTIDLKAEDGRHQGRDRTGAGILDDNNWHDHRDISGTLSQRIFDGFEARHEVARQEHRVESARWRVNDTANSIALRAVQAYLEMQRATAVLGAAKGNLQTLRALNTRVQERVAGGKGNASDETEAGSRLANAVALVAEAEGRVRDADALYRSVVGHAPATLGPVRVPASALPKSVEDAVAEAVVAAPSVIATQNDTVAAQAAVGGAYSRFSPKLNFELTGTGARGDKEDGDSTGDVRAMFVVRWNLINGGIDKARVFEARARAWEASEISANTQRIVERETRISWNGMTAAQQRVPALTRELELNRATRAAYVQQFDAGQRRLLDLLDVQNEVFVSEASLRTEELAAKYNTYRVLASMGRLLPAIGLELPEEATQPPAANMIETWRNGPSFFDGNWHTEVHEGDVPASGK